VRPGDTLGSIGARHGTDGSTIAGLNKNLIGQGQPMTGQRVRVR
jgi:hypothetical protein